MNPEVRRLILNCNFDRALETVLDACLEEGFTIAIAGAGNLHRCASRDRSLRYALLDATLPELSSHAGTATTPTMLGCRVSLFEIAGSWTVFTVEIPVVRRPAIASPVPSVADRVAQIMRRLVDAGVLNAA
jgi:hypothetical protein